MACWLTVARIGVAAAIVLAGAAQGRAEAIAPLYRDPELFLRAIAATSPAPGARARTTGLTVPHHLLAADLMAEGFRWVENTRYDKIIVLSPDHFKRSKRPFATTARDFGTVFGTVATAREDVERLLGNADLVESSDLFEREHGVAALTPFIRKFLPDTAIVPVAVSITASRAELDRMADALAPLVTAQTLILQSTDFSHFLPQHEAARRDQETLNVISAGDHGAVAGLLQPQHTDSRGSQYLQMRLQARKFSSAPTVLLNANSQRYSDRLERSTTSYIVQVYAALGREPSLNQDPSAHAKTFCFAGDTFFGRHVARLLANQPAATALRDKMRTLLNGCPLIVNLEGVLVPEVPEGLGPLTLAMPERSTLAWLKTLNVVAVSVANNHARDLGDAAFDGMVRALRDAGIQVLRHGDIADLGAFRLVALSDLDNSGDARRGLVTEGDIERLRRAESAPPLFAFLHWGREYENRPGERELALIDALRQSAVPLIVGAHSHRASAELRALAGGEALLAYSLGNFLFDQRGERVSGAVLEVRVFEQGTFAARLVPIPNLYEHGLKARQ